MGFGFGLGLGLGLGLEFSRMTAMKSESMTKVSNVTKLMKYGSANMVPQCLPSHGGLVA